MFSLFEKVLTPTGVPERPEPPSGLIGFYWHFARQAKGLFLALFVVEFFVAILDTAVPWFIGRTVTLITNVPADRFLAETWPWLVGMALVILVARPGIILARYLITNQAIAGPFTAATVGTGNSIHRRCHSSDEAHRRRPSASSDVAVSRKSLRLACSVRSGGMWKSSKPTTR